MKILVDERGDSVPNLAYIGQVLREVIHDLKAHQKELDGRIDGRSLAVAVTNAETAILWLEKALG